MAVRRGLARRTIWLAGDSWQQTAECLTNWVAASVCDPLHCVVALSVGHSEGTCYTS